MSSHARFRLLLDSLNGHRELQSLGEDLLDESEALKAQRDELLGLLRRVRQWGTFALNGTDLRPLALEIDAAIAKEEGER